MSTKSAEIYETAEIVGIYFDSIPWGEITTPSILNADCAEKEREGEHLNFQHKIQRVKKINRCIRVYVVCLSVCLPACVCVY